jgi:hypothetical protein
MFSKSITNSSRFLMMPESSQNLYFHLGMNADDDGFCEHFAVMRMVGSKPDDLKILHAKGFVNVFDDHVLVIMDWKENNYLRSDRYTASKYLAIYNAELKQITCGIPSDNQMATQVRLGKVRLGKDSIGKNRLDKKSRKTAPKETHMDHVLISKEEWEDLTNNYEEKDIEPKIAYINCEIANKNSKYLHHESHYAIIKKFLVNDVMAGLIKKKPRRIMCPECAKLGIEKDITGKSYCTECERRENNRRY